MKPTKIYLDHKDYVRITDGLRGAANCKLDVETFDLIREHVKRGEITVYFSWVHVYEALKYKGQNSDILDQYCKVIDAITRGNCIIWPLELEKRELELFLSEQFDFVSRLEKGKVAYGKYSDAVMPTQEYDDEDLSNIVKKHIMDAALNRHQRKSIERLWVDPLKRRKLLEELLPTDLSWLKKQFPAGPDFYTKQNILELICSTTNTRRITAKQIIDGSFTFENLLTHYALSYPELRQFAETFDPVEKRLITEIKRAQAVCTATGKWILKEEDVVSNLTDKLIEALGEEIDNLARTHGFLPETARERLRSSKLAGIPSRYVILLTISEYLRRHRGDLEQGRDPQLGDLRDIFHAVNIPYVDFFLTDRFFSTVAGKGGKFSGTTVLRSLSQLKGTIENP